jgi:hypothetical protein
MPLLARGIQRRRWDRQSLHPWLERAEIPADPLTDFRTQDNQLSMFIVEDNQSNLAQVITALAATRGRPDKYDYLLFEEQVLSTVNVTVHRTRGDTPDNAVNSWHLDLVDLSGSKLLALVTEILHGQFVTGRWQEHMVKDSLQKGLEAGRLDPSRMPRSLRDSVLSP